MQLEHLITKIYFEKIKNKKPDYEMMTTFITAIKKLVIKDVVHFADSKIEATKLVSNKMN